MKRKTNKTKSIIGLAMGAVFALSAAPIVNLPTIFKANADEPIRSVYKETEIKVDNLNFENLVSGSYSLDDWESDYVSKDEGAKEKYSTTTSGALNITPDGYTDNYTTQYEENWLTYWDGNFPTIPNFADVREALEADITAPTNPLTHNITEGTSKNKRVLYIDAGTSYGDFEGETFTSLSKEAREVYYTYTSNSFTLDAYSYYRITVWVKTDGGLASIALGKDLENEYFEDITANASVGDNICIYKKVTDAGVTTYLYKDLADALTSGDDYIDGETTYTYVLDGGNDTWVDQSTNTKITLFGNGNNSGWTKHTIFVSTAYNKDNAGKYTTNLQLSLGDKEGKSSGVVYFDDAKVEKIQYSTYLKGIEDKNGGDDTIAIANYRETAENDYRVISNFNGIDKLHESGWSIDSQDYTNYAVKDIQVEENITDIYSTFGDSSNKILYANNWGDKALGLTSTKTTVEPFNYYRVSIWSRSDYKKTDSSNQSFKIFLNATLNSKTVSTKELEVKPYNSAYTNENPSSITNFWTETVLLVESCPVYSTDVWLTISIPKKSCFMFDNFVIEKISSTEYSDSDNTKLSLTSSLGTDSVPNGHFNLISTKENEHNELYSAGNWKETLTTKVDVYKYYDDASDNAHTSIINNENYTFDDSDADNRFITYQDKTFSELDDNAGTFVYMPYRYKLTKYDEHGEPLSDIRNIDLPTMITGNTYVHEGLSYTLKAGSSDIYIYEDPSGEKQIIEFYDQSIATEKIVIAKDVTFSFEEKEDAFTSGLYSGFKLYEGSLEDDKIHHGIINGYNYDESVLDTENISFINPKNVYENYLAIKNHSFANPTQTIKNLKVSYKSEKISIPASTYKNISVCAFVNSDFAGDITINLLDTNSKILATQKVEKQVLTSLTKDDEETNWQTVSFYLKNGISTSTVYLEIIYGSNDATSTGTVLFKTATVKNSSSGAFTKLTSDKSFTERKDELTSLVELGGESFVELGESLGNGYYTSLTTKATDSSTGSVSILDTSTDKDALASYIYESASSPYVLVVKNSAGQSTTTKGNQSYTLSASSFYKFTVVAKAKSIEEGKSAKLTFANFTENLEVSSDEFKTYTFFIATTDKAVTTDFAVELLNASGEIVVDNLTLTKIDESAFKSGTEEIADKTLTIFSDLRPDSEEGDKDDEPIEKDNNTLEILFAALSSLLLVGAIVFALVFTRVNVLKGKGKKPRMKNKVKAGDDDEHGFV